MKDDARSALSKQAACDVHDEREQVFDGPPVPAR